MTALYLYSMAYCPLWVVVLLFSCLPKPGHPTGGASMFHSVPLLRELCNICPCPEACVGGTFFKTSRQKLSRCGFAVGIGLEFNPPPLLAEAKSKAKVPYWRIKSTLA
jgi:hypothetical protein